MATTGNQRNIRGIIPVYLPSLLRKKRHLIILTVSFALLLVVIFLFPLISAAGYSIITSTICQPGTQSATLSWILMSVYVSLAFGSLTAGWRFYDGFIFQRVMLIIFCLNLILTGLFKEAPVNPDISYNITEAAWHAYFEGAAVLSFIILSLSTSLIPEKPYDRLITVATGISVILLLILKSEAGQFAGIWHRAIFIIMFGWQLYTFS